MLELLYKLLLGHDVSYLGAYFAVHTDINMINGCFKQVSTLILTEISTEAETFRSRGSN